MILCFFLSLFSGLYKGEAIYVCDFMLQQTEDSSYVTAERLSVVPCSPKKVATKDSFFLIVTLIVVVERTSI